MYENLISDLSPQWFRYLQERNYGVDSENRPICLDPIIANWLKKDIDQMNVSQFTLLSLQERKYYLKICLMLLTSTKGLITSIKENMNRFTTYNIIRSILGSEEVHKRLSPCRMMKDPNELIRKLDLFGSDYSGWFSAKEGELLLQRMVSLGTDGGNVLACELVHRGVAISFELCMEIGELGGLLYSIQESRVNGFHLKRSFEKISSESISEHDTKESTYRTSNQIYTSEEMLKQLEEYDEAILKDFVVVDGQLKSYSNEDIQQAKESLDVRALKRRIREMEIDQEYLPHPIEEMTEHIKRSKDLLDKIQSTRPVSTITTEQEVAPFSSFQDLIEGELERRQSLSIAEEDLQEIRQQLHENEEKENEATILSTFDSDSDVDIDIDEDVEEQLTRLLSPVVSGAREEDNEDNEDDIEKQLQILLRVTSQQMADTEDLLDTADSLD
jgi:hypothetical protein